MSTQTSKRTLELCRMFKIRETFKVADISLERMEIDLNRSMRDFERINSLSFEGEKTKHEKDALLILTRRIGSIGAAISEMKTDIEVSSQNKPKIYQIPGSCEFMRVYKKARNHEIEVTSIATQAKAESMRDSSLNYTDLTNEMLVGKGLRVSEKILRDANEYLFKKGELSELVPSKKNIDTQAAV